MIGSWNINLLFATRPWVQQHLCGRRRTQAGLKRWWVFIEHNSYQIWSMRYQDKGWEIEMSDLRNRTFSIWESRHIKELKLDYWMSFEFAHFAQDCKPHLCLHWKVARYCEWHWVEEVHILLRADQPRDLPARCFIILSNSVPPANLGSCNPGV